MCVDDLMVHIRDGVVRRTFRSISSRFLASSSFFTGSSSSLASGLICSDARTSGLTGASASAGVVE